MRAVRLANPKSITISDSRAVHPQYLVGGAAVSRTDDLFGEWDLQSHATPAYTTHVHDSAGGTEVFARRERPKLLLDEKGAPEVLYTAVCPGTPKGDGLCYTHAQKIGAKSDDHEAAFNPHPSSDSFTTYNTSMWNYADQSMGTTDKCKVWCKCSSALADLLPLSKTHC